MNNFIYLSLPWLATYDPTLLSDTYQYHKWFHLKKAEHWPVHTTSRVHQLDTPWPLAQTVYPIPKISHNELRFDVVLEEIAEQFCRYVDQSKKIPYICWSGGIDSTTILVSILKVATPEFLQKVIILYSNNSIVENSYFFYKYINKKLTIKNIDEFKITSDNYADIVVVDGEAGNQTMGMAAIHKLIYSSRHDLLDCDWRTIADLKTLLMGATDFNIDLVRESIKHSPVDIKTGNDFLWWTNFNFKFDDVLLRKSVSYTEHLSAAESQLFFAEGLYRFYTDPKMQVWSMLSMDLRRESGTITPKYIPKKYIFDFDKNDLYFSNKSEEGSASEVFFNKDVGTRNSSVFAIDSDWNKYNINDAATRRLIGKILHKC
jgi:hypothetical protein